MGNIKIKIAPWNEAFGEWVTLSEVTVILKLNQRTVRRLANNNEIETKLALIDNRPQLLYFIKTRHK